MSNHSVLIARGFRPFYLLAAIFAILAVLVWLLAFAGVLHTEGYLRGIFWHSHEMVFGFGMAVMTGFLLTAVRNWTGLPTLTGPPLAGLAVLWIAGRVMVISGPPLLAAAIDVLFVPLLAVAIARPVLKSRNRRNYKIVVLLLLIGLANVVYHLASLGPLPAWLAYTSVIAAMDLMTLTYAIVAGRVIPAFTGNAVPDAEPGSFAWLEFLAFASLLLIIVLRLVSDWAPVPVILSATLLIVAAVAHTFRLALWQPQKTASNTLLWMLPVAYSWLPVAFFLRALAQYSIVGQAAWVHALTMGAISSLMLAMMMRSSLGHTGRPLIASGVDMGAYLLLQFAAILRVAAGLFPDSLYAAVVAVSGGLWVLAFGSFLIRYTPMLLGPRADGRSG
jgi:uncharacterized protein involved in response to NO